MVRTLPAALETHIGLIETTPLLMLKAEFDSGDLNLWSGYGDLIYDSDTYTGGGQLLGITSIRESSENRANGTAISLTGVSTSIISIAEDEDYQERPFTLLFSALESDGSLIDPYQLFSGFMDVMTSTDSAATATINMTVENAMADLERPNSSNYTAESQRREFPTDTGFKWMVGLQNLNFVWGK